MTIRNYRDLAVWTKAMGVAKLDVSFLSASDVDPVLADIEEVGRMLNALHAKLKAAPNT